jgi:GTP1/Obg family GTP-binding protein
VEEQQKMESRQRRGNARGSWGVPQQRKHTTHKIQVLSSSITRPLREVVEGHRRIMQRLHPFERVVAELTVRSR